MICKKNKVQIDYKEGKGRKPWSLYLLKFPGVLMVAIFPVLSHLLRVDKEIPYFRCRKSAVTYIQVQLQHKEQEELSLNNKTTFPPFICQCPSLFTKFAQSCKKSGGNCRRQTFSKLDASRLAKSHMNKNLNSDVIFVRFY